jgi:predicted Holliday junction resolvase-like endonuclease
VDTSLGSLIVGIGIGAGIALLVIAVLAPRHLRDARRSAIDQHRAVTHGQVYEQLVPYLPDFDFYPTDARFLGRPVDFVVFDGLDEGELRRIVFVEVKTGGSKLTSRERFIRDAIREGRVSWKEVRGSSQDMGPSVSKSGLDTRTLR